jgi:hypothetical protein
MPKNQPIPPVPSDIRRSWLKLCARPGGCSRGEFYAKFKNEIPQFGTPFCVYRTWSRQLVAERVARFVERGRATRLVASPSRLRARVSQIPGG